MVLFAVFAGLVSVVLLLVLWIQNRYSFWKSMGAPYEKPSFLIGNLKDVARNVDHVGGTLQKLYQKHKGKNPFVGIFMFLKPTALLVDIELVKHVLIKDFNNFHDRGVFYNERDDPVSAHLFALHGPKWKLLRHKLSPTFTSGKMKMMFPTILDVAKRFEATIDETSREGMDVDIKKLMARFTIEVIGTCAFGLDCNSVADEDSEFCRIGPAVFSNPRHSLAVDLLMTSCRGVAQKLGCKRFRDEVGEFYTRVVRSTVDYRISKNIRRNDFMDLLIDLYTTDDVENKLTFNEVLAQAFVFFIAGFETSSTTLQFAFYELASNPDIQEKARQHIDDVLQKHDGKLTYEAMMDMKYLDQIINETLRLYPPVMTLLRETDKDYRVPGTKYVFKRGVITLIPAYAIQRDPEFYPNPDKFDPVHFSNENVQNRPSVAFLPFGEGPRICIGARFGMMQARVGLITALRKYKCTLSPKTAYPIQLSKKSFITTAEGGIWLNMTPL